MVKNLMTTNSSQPLLLRGARLVLPDRVTDKSNLLVEDGRIQLIFEGGHAVPHHPVQTYDLDGLTLFPGFIDIHIHGAVGVDTTEADADALHKVARFLARHGVTGWLPTLVPAPVEDYRRAVTAIEQLMREQGERDAGARVLGLHYEGPFVNSAQCGALRTGYFRAFKDATTLDELPIVDDETAARMITVAPEIDGGIALVKELTERGWIVSIGHTRASVDVLDQAREAGARHMTHFMNAMSPLHHRAPGPVGWGLLRDDVTCDLIADGIHLDPLVLQLVVRCKTPARVALISDSVAPTGLGDGAYKVWGETIRVDQGRTSNERGSIAGSVINMLDAARLMLSLGLAATDVAQMAATNPARLIGVSQDCGSIEEGKRADLTCLDAEGSVRLTLVGGRIAFDNMA
jgi:N-acetylglucosamine-6-phosphate deacetylase